MTPMFVRSLVLAASTSLVASLSGCAAADDTAPVDGEQTTDVESAASVDREDVIAQGHVTAAFNFALGGESSKELELNHPCEGVKIGEESMRRLLKDLNSFRENLESGVARLGPAKLTEIRGLLAVARALKVKDGLVPSSDGELPASTYLMALTESFATCWGERVRPFVYVGEDKLAYFDPEPANLTQSLSGTTGASAAAVYANSREGTKVVYWAGSFRSNTLGLAAGTPCSTSGLGSGNTVLQVIQAQGNFAKCL